MFQQAATYYRNKFNFSVIPVGQDKRPLIKWQGYQKEKPDDKQIQEWGKKFPRANVGIVTGRISNIAVVDIDEEQGYQEIAKYIPCTVDFPICSTPSGGQHWYFRMPEQDIRLNARVIPGCDLRAEGGYIVAPPSKTDKGEYKWLESIKDTEMPKLPESYVNKVMSSSVANVSSSVVGCRQMSSSMFQQGHRDEDLFHTANCLIKGGMAPEAALQVLRILGAQCNFPESDIAIKVKSALERAKKKERNIAEEVREWVLSSTGVFLSSDVVKCLQLSSRSEQQNLSKVLNRLSTENIIEKHGNRNGQWRVVDHDLEVLDWKRADTAEIPLILPLNVHEYVKIMPKNLIVIAGSPNAGKTAFLLNIVKSNMYKYNINYFSSEMSECEMRGRLQNFHDVSLDDWKFKAYNRCSNFADVIQPDEINIIDFLELHDEFWKVGALFKEIYEKLDKGVAIIAIQKKHGARTGKGGDITLEKPRLYLSMEGGKVRIEKGKNWRHPSVNPNKLECLFKLVQGSKFIIDADWQHGSD